MIKPHSLTLFSNLLQWQKGYLGRQSPVLPAYPGFVKKAKPFVRFLEEEILVYAISHNIDYLTQKCFFAKITNILNDFLDYLNNQTSMKLCSYSGSRFDRRVLQKRFCNHSIESLPFERRIEMDLGIEIQHMLLAKIKDYQLKTVGNFFGYPWKYKNRDYRGYCNRHNSTV